MQLHEGVHTWLTANQCALASRCLCAADADVALQTPDPEWEAAVKEGKAAGCVWFSQEDKVSQVGTVGHGSNYLGNSRASMVPSQKDCRGADAFFSSHSNSVGVIEAEALARWFQP